MKGLFHRSDKQALEVEELQIPNPARNANVFSLRFPSSPANLDELKQNFLNQLLRFQMKWGSSTLREKSFVDQSFFLDERLRFFLQRFPDTFLVLYKPIFLLKNAPVEVDVILLTPVDASCITFFGSGGRFGFHSDRAIDSGSAGIISILTKKCSILYWLSIGWETSSPSYLNYMK